MQGLSFSPHNVPMVLAGTKDVTRRIIRFPTHINADNVATIKHLEAKTWVALDKAGVCLGHLKSRYFPGETVFLSEQYSLVDGEIVYRSDYEPDPKANRKSVTWTPPWLLSATMARHQLLIRSMRGERLQVIQGSDVLREGVWRPPPTPPPAPASGPAVKGECVDLEFLHNKFARAWDEINAHRKGGAAWAVNPFVWRIETQRLIEENQAHG